jgi:hypothetical protein
MVLLTAEEFFNYKYAEPLPVKGCEIYMPLLGAQGL